MQNGSIQAKNGENVTREAWLVTASQLCVTELFKPALPEIDAPLYRVSLTAPKGTATSTVLGECWNPAASTAGITEIFITAEKGRADSVAILTTLVHEMSHAFDRNMSGHKAGFSVRMSQKNIGMMKTTPECLSCNTGTMRQAL